MRVLYFIESSCCVTQFGDFVPIEFCNGMKKAEWDEEVELQLSRIPFSIFEEAKRGERKRIFYQVWQGEGK